MSNPNQYNFLCKTTLLYLSSEAEDILLDMTWLDCIECSLYVVNADPVIRLTRSTVGAFAITNSASLGKVRLNVYIALKQLQENTGSRRRGVPVRVRRPVRCGL